MATPEVKILSSKQLLTKKRVLLDVAVSSKKSLLKIVSALFQKELKDCTTQSILDHLIQRERMGDTCLGQGIALPHARIPGLKQTLASFVRLSQPIDFGQDHEVNLIFTLALPEQTASKHNALLAALAEKFNNQPICQQLKNSVDKGEIIALFSDLTVSNETGENS